MLDSIFTKIIKGEIPCHKVYEDERTFAFLDIHPIQPGHILVIPKVQIQYLWDLEDVDYQAVLATAKLLAHRLRVVFPEKERIAMLVEGIEVPHAHIKLFPFTTVEEFQTQPDTQLTPNHESLAAIARKLAVNG